jgi:Uncharacterized alpha/beta hydrolase domain (DUF2235)
MKKLIVCCDGTWNSADQEELEVPAPTNVVRFYNALAEADGAVPQRKYYHPGVGTEGGLLSRTAGGIYGYGLSQNIMSAYAWLGRHYEVGDQIYLFGFSRGAFTARSLGGMLGRVGILDLTNAVDPFPDEVKPEEILSPTEAWRRVEAAYEAYRELPPGTPRTQWAESWKFSAGPGVAITLIGVWDTVGALGIPNNSALLNLFDRPQKWLFHDATLGPQVAYARHAVAMDEMRASFTPTLWVDVQGRPLHDVAPAGSAARVRQVFFPGAHSDVGGGYHDCGLAEGALKWMIDEAAALPGAQRLAFVPELVAQIAPNPLAPIHNSVRGLFTVLPTRPRNLPPFSHTDRYHASALTRLKTPPIFQSPYRAPARVMQPGQPAGVSPAARAAASDRILSKGESSRCNVYAVHPWNATGLYLEANVDYTFEAVGEWMDGNITCGPAGTNDGKFQLAELKQIAGSALGQIEALWKKATGNQQADLPATKRVERAPWFSLIGVVANDANKGGPAPLQPGKDGTPPEHQELVIGRKLERFRLSHPGHLYAFANDAWHFYGNNRGSVTLRVTRV